MYTHLLKGITGISLLVALVFPILYSSALVNQSSFPKAIFFYLCSQIVAFLFLWDSTKKGKITIPKNYLCLGLFIYILVLILSGILGENFRQSFWSYYPHMTGILTWLHFFVFYIAVSSVYQKIHWKHFFRALSISTTVLLVFSYLGSDGWDISSILPGGGSLLTNNTKSGMYYVLFFFMSFIGFSLEEGKKWRSFYIFVLVAIFFSPELFNNDILTGEVPISSILGDPTKLLGLARSSTIVLWFGMIFSGALYLVHKLGREKLKEILVMGSIVLFLIIYGVFVGAFVGRNEQLINTMLGSSLASRVIVWDIAVKAIKQNPVLGSGPENFDYVYQQSLDARVINLENGGAWFDRTHNFVLDELTTVGIAGFLSVALLFFIVIRTSLLIYRKQKKFHFLLIPYILILHFLQLQTAFQTITSLFLVLVLFAYLSSQDGDTVSIPVSAQIKNIIKIISVPLLIILLYFAVYVPLKQGAILTKLENSGTFEKRIGKYKENQKNIKNLSVSPDQIIQRYVNEYIFALAPNIDTIYKNDQKEQAKEETLLYLDLYESYYPRYKDKYKFLIYYAHTINFAYMLGVDKLEKGEQLLREALEISKAYPHPYLALAVNLYNQGRIEEALLYAKQGYDIDRTIIKSKDIYETLEARALLPNVEKSSFYLPSL